MCYRHIWFVGMLLFVTAAHAQSAPPPPPSTLSDSWSTPAPAHSGSAAYRSAPSLGSSANAATHFQFKPRQPAMPADPAPGDGTNKVPIFGTNQVGADGRPPVNCPQNPRDPACR